jgi:hypothetical protein
MAILTSDEIFFTAFEPKVQNRFIMYVDGIPAYLIKGVSGLGFEQGEIILNHINVYRKIKGKLRWNDLNLTLFDPITPSGAQAVMEWVRLHHESVTGRDGYSDFYKKDVVIDIVGPVGDVVSEWVIKGAFIKNANFGDLNFDNDSAAQNITMTLGMDYCVLNY